MDATIFGGKWKKVRQLPSGGQADTYLVTLETEREPEGVLKQANRPSSKAKDRMLCEVANLKRLHGIGVKVPGVLDFGNTRALGHDEPPWFVMDFIPGKTLDSALQDQGALGLNQAVAVAADLAGTVAQVHRAGILHRDLKPSNLMVRRLGAEADIVLLDCGLSFHKKDETTKDITGQDPIRNKFLSLSEGNTPGGNRRDPRSDLTAVAGILFYCLTRKNIGLLFDGAAAPHHRPACSVRELLGDVGDNRRRKSSCSSTGPSHSISTIDSRHPMNCSFG